MTAPASAFLLPLPAPPTPSRTPTATALAHSLLQDGEEWIYAQDGVGLYQGNSKIPTHQLLSVQLTTHRLLFILPPSSDGQPAPPHLQLHLADIRQVEHYTGFLRSSPKITIQLGISTDVTTDTTDAAARNQAAGGNWTCAVCGFQNDAPPNSRAHYSASNPPKCQLCGIARTTTPTAASASMPDSATTTNTTTAIKQVACPRCTYLNNPDLETCEICNGPLRAASAAAATAAPPNEVVRVSFRKGGDKEVYRRLKVVLGSRTWERRMGGAGQDIGSRAGTPRSGIGIDGILANIELENQSKRDEVKDAFEDLEALMVRAGEMVKLVQSLNAKLSATPHAGTDMSDDSETRTFLRSSLVQLGLPVPAITKDDKTMRDEREYLEALAVEFGGVLTGGEGGEAKGLMTGKEGKGVLGMDEAWVVWNRARGVSLISPSTMQKVVPLLPTHTRPPITHLRFLNGLEVLHTPLYAPLTFAHRIARALDALAESQKIESGEPDTATEPFTTILDIALGEGLSVSVTREMLAFVQMVPECGLVRDDQGSAASGFGGGPVEERWYRDLMTGFVWVDVNP